MNKTILDLDGSKVAELRPISMETKKHSLCIEWTQLLDPLSSLRIAIEEYMEEMECETFLTLDIALRENVYRALRELEQFSLDKGEATPFLCKCRKLS
jgi:hypothetical protein